MNFAYLILAHKSPRQLHRLIQALYSDDDVFIIHIDAKTAIRPFIRYFENYPPGKILFCPHRKNIIWGGYSMVEATLSLIRFFFQMDLKAGYLHLISGQDYPVKSRKELTDFFKINKGKNFLEFFTLPDNEWPEIGLNRIKYLWEVNEDKNIFYTDLNYKKSCNPTLQFPEGITPYGGSQWWSLHIDCVRFLMDEYSRNNPLFRVYRYSLVPDEMVFQTLILNSHFKDTAVNDNLRFIKWQPGATHPETIGLRHLNSLLAEEKLFARKFEPEYDSNVIAQLDLYRNMAR